MATPKFATEEECHHSRSNGESKENRAFVTFLAGSGDYVKGTIGLAKGLRKAKSSYPLVVAVLNDVPLEHREMLSDQGCIVREIESIHPPENSVQFAMPYYVINYSKLRIWQFEEYSKMVYLDSDIQIFESIDHLFDLPDGYFYAVKDCFCEKTWSHTPQYKIGYCQQCPEKVQWPSHLLGTPPQPYFNAGMFVFEPSNQTFMELMQTLQTTPPTAFAEQDFLNFFFGKVFKPIPWTYNLVMAMLWRHPDKIDLDQVKVVHYCAAGSKPWRYNGREENMQREDIRMLVDKWWAIYNDPALDLAQPKRSADAGGEHAETKYDHAIASNGSIGSNPLQLVGADSFRASIGGATSRGTPAPPAA